MKISWFGTASVLIEIGDERFLFDPFKSLKGGENCTELDTFSKERHIFITHGHFDHLYNVKDIMDLGCASIYCTSVPYRILQKQGADISRLNLVAHDDNLDFSGVTVTPLKSKHNVPNMRLFYRTLLRFGMIRHFKNFRLMAKKYKLFDEGGETTAYFLKGNNQCALVLGSMGLDENINYPVGVDLLVLPYQGNIDNLTPSLKIVERIKPKAIFLDHFDNSFPPITKSINTDEFFTAISERYPNMRVIKPLHSEVVEV